MSLGGRFTLFSVVLSSLLALHGPTADATIVRMSTVLGNIDVRLYDTATPITTANFLNYADTNRYDNSFIHRSITNFVVQGGGFTYASDQTGIDSVPQFAQITNEPGITNARGTIAMAKLPTGPNTASSQWFFNLANNAGPPPDLDHQNGGFTVFGRVLGTGMSVVDAIAAIPSYNIGGAPFDFLPLRNYTGSAITKSNLVIINSVDVRNLSAGDYNFDGAVTIADYNVWKSSFGSTVLAEADGNGNGKVDLADYVVWRDSMPPGGSLVSGSVPEPSTLALVFCTAIGALFGRQCSCRRKC